MMATAAGTIRSVVGVAGRTRGVAVAGSMRGALSLGRPLAYVVGSEAIADIIPLPIVLPPNDHHVITT